MTEFNEREKIIVVATTFIGNPLTKGVPDDVIIMGLMVMLKTKNIEINSNELKDIIAAVRKEQQDTIKEGFGALAKMKDGNI